MSSEEYPVVQKVPAWEVEAYVFYKGGSSAPRTSTALSVREAVSHIRYRWATEELGSEKPPLGAQVVVLSTKRVFIFPPARRKTRALASR